MRSAINNRDEAHRFHCHCERSEAIQLGGDEGRTPLQMPDGIASLRSQ
jgi:hypothetical protein